MTKRPSLLPLLLQAALVCCLLACGPKPADRTPAPEGPQDQLLLPSALPFDFMWRQRVTAEWPAGKQSFEAVLQKRNGELTLLGLSPMGLPGFVLTLRADGSLHVDNRMGRELPFEPRFIVADVQRVFFPWLAPVDAAFAGQREGEQAGLRLREQFAGGHLAAREFRRAASPESGAVRITYASFPPAGDAPLRVTLDNEWHRYRLVIETFEQQRL